MCIGCDVLFQEMCVLLAVRPRRGRDDFSLEMNIAAHLLPVPISFHNQIEMSSSIRYPLSIWYS